MMMKLELNDRAAVAMKNGTKRIENRANKGNHDYSTLKPDDIIEFTSDPIGVFYVKVLEVNHYNSVEEELTMEGTRYTLSSTNDKKEGIKAITGLNGYEEAIKKNRIYAIHIKYLYSKDTVWEELYKKAKDIRVKRDISGMISAGSVGAAILTKGHNIFTGVCIDTSSSLGMCAERNAIANMITNGESEIEKLVCIDSNGKIGSPCGACREYLMQLSKNSPDIEILTDLEKKKTVKLKELVPDWWGKDRV